MRGTIVGFMGRADRQKTGLSGAVSMASPDIVTAIRLFAGE